jgi:hypothetical protein
VESIPGKPCHTVLRSVFRLDMKSANFLALTSNCLDDNNLSRSGIPVWVAAVVLVGEEEICSPLFCFHGLLESCMLMCQVRAIQWAGCQTCWQGGHKKLDAWRERQHLYTTWDFIDKLNYWVQGGRR